MSKKSKKVARKKKKANDSFSTPSYLQSNQGLFKKIFYLLYSVLAILTFAMAFSTGSNEDDKFHHQYSEKLVNYYTSFGEDTSALYVDYGKMHLYGGELDLLSGFVNRMLGYDRIDDLGYMVVRDVFKSLYGLVALLFMGLLFTFLGGWHWGIVGLLFTFLSARFYGHAVINPRDFPFAAGYIMATYFIIKSFVNIEKPSWKVFLGIAGGIAIAVGARSGGVLLVFYFGLFALLRFYQFAQSKKSFKLNQVYKYAAFAAAAVVLGLLISFILWPYALQSPFQNIQNSITKYSSGTVNLSMLFDGSLQFGADIDVGYYILRYLTAIFPLFVLSGLILAVVFGKGIIKKVGWISIFVLAFISLFPLSYIVYKGSKLYDGVRHILFTMPGLIAISGIAWSYLIEKYWNKKSIRYTIIGVLALLMINPMVHYVRNFSHAYVFFNPIAGGANGTFGKFEHDYWGVSVKEGSDWLEKNGYLVGGSEENPIVITSNSPYVLNRALLHLKPKVKVVYSRFRERDAKNWDYAIYISRFVDPALIKEGNWPSEKAIHTINYNHKPIAIILKNENKWDQKGYQALKKGQVDEAIKLYQQEVEAFPSNDNGFEGLGKSYMQKQDFLNAADAFSKALNLNPENRIANFYIGNAYLRAGQVQTAINHYHSMIRNKIMPDQAHFNLANIYLQTGKANEAAREIEASLKLNPNNLQAYQLGAQIYNKTGNKARAKQFQRIVNQNRR